MPSQRTGFANLAHPAATLPPHRAAASTAAAYSPSPARTNNSIPTAMSLTSKVMSQRRRSSKIEKDGICCHTNL